MKSTSNGITTINYELPSAGKITLEVRNVMGQLVSVTNASAQLGKNSLELNTNTYPAGIYSYTLKFNSNQLTKRMVILGE